MVQSNLNQKGSVSVEWVILTMAMVVALFAPLPGTEQSLAGLMMQSIRDFYASISFLLSLP